jgi:transglutaminase-like putative cysteine protease
MAQTKSKLDWWTVLLLAFMLAMSAYTVAGSDWAPGLELLQPTSLAALLLGILLTRAKFRPFQAHLLALGYGAVWIAFTALPYLTRAAGAEGLRENMTALGRHIGEWVWLLLQTGVGKDNYMFLLSLMVVFWLLGYFAAWYTFRAVHVLRVALPPGLVILVNLYYYGGRTQLSIFLYLYFAAVLLYLARVHFMLREREWQRTRVGYDKDVRASFVRGGSIVTLFAVVVSWAVPQFAPMPQLDDLWRQISRPVRSIEDSFNRLFSALQGDGPVLTNPFGRTLGFAGARSLGDTVMMDVYVHQSTDNADALARYWRAGTYDVYTSNGWINSAADSYIFSPSADELLTPYAQRSNVKQTFTFYFPRTSLLIAAAQPVYFGLDAEADALFVTASTGSSAQRNPTFVEPSIVTSRDLLRPGDSYDVVSSLPIADLGTLRSAGTDYPDWVAERYLELPDSFPQRVKDLAQQIVDEADATNPFDQATALERWLRRNIAYNEKIEGPQPGQDGVDYVLFEARAGYCDYYAASMATMARSLGIPARVAVGYARGEFEESGGVYRVRERDAHSWVEVFFPNYGWVEFEPTAAQPLINRPVAAEPGEDAGLAVPPPPLDPADRLSRLGEDRGLDVPASDVLPNLTTAFPSGLLVVAGVLLAGAVVVVSAIYVYENRGLMSLRGARWAYARLVRLARWLRVEMRPAQTPYEQAKLLNEAAPGSRQAIDAITGDFVRETFGRDGADPASARSLWRQIHIRLWWAGLERRALGAFERIRWPGFLKLPFLKRGK